MTTLLQSSDMYDAWKAVRDAEEPSFQEVVIENLPLPNANNSLDEFFDAFLADDADHSFLAFQRDVIGDTNLEVTPWKQCSHTDTVVSWTRTITYCHPIQAPVGPPSAHATKEQTLRRFGDYGLCLETRTIVVGVPVADCFHVDDLILVEQATTTTANATNGDKGKANVTLQLRLQAKFAVRFVKKTMLKKIVKSTTTAEMTDFYQHYKTFVLQAKLSSSQPSSSQQSSPLNLFLCGMEDAFVNPFQDLEVGYPFTIMEQKFTKFEEAIGNTFGIHGDDPSDNTAKQPTITKPLQQQQEEEDTDPRAAVGVELVYLAGLASQLRTSKSNTMSLQERQRVQAAMPESSQWESLCGGTVRCRQSSSLSSNEEELLGYSVMKDAVVAAMEEEQQNSSSSFAMERALEVVAY